MSSKTCILATLLKEMQWASRLFLLIVGFLFLTAYCDVILLSTDEGSFITRIFVFTCLLLVLSKYQQGQIFPLIWYLVFYNEDQF
jgi:hypothetical protein